MLLLLFVCIVVFRHCVGFCLPTVNSGRDISDISEFNGKFATEDQQEVLFTNGTKFKIVSTDTDLFGTIYVKMREL